MKLDSEMFYNSLTLSTNQYRPFIFFNLMVLVSIYTTATIGTRIFFINCSNDKSRFEITLRSTSDNTDSGNTTIIKVHFFYLK